MCGISTLCNTALASPLDPYSLEKALLKSLQTIQYRGPDASGIYISSDSRVGLGHVRLSIIDLEGGQQPLSDEDGLIHCVVAGELYNYDVIRSHLEAKGSTFKTRSDSELIPHLYKHYGVGLLSWLRGEFTFVLYDSKRHLLVSARDRFGIKPLYYTFSQGRLLIASETKAFIPLGWKPEWDIESIVHGGEHADDRTVFKGVYKVPPGHYLTFDCSDHLKLFPYWDHSYSSEGISPTQSVDDMITTVRDRLVESVRLRLRSDVPLAMYLSGGIDSAAVAGIASSILKEKDPKAQLNVFTLAFPARGELDEGPVARRMAVSIGANFCAVEPTEGDLVDKFEECVWHSECPLTTFHGPGKTLLSKHIREKGFKVVLSGEGSDEIFGGYPFLLLDYLRHPDTNSQHLGINLPSTIELSAALKMAQTLPPSQNTSSLDNMTQTDSPTGRALLGDLFTSRVIASASAPPSDLFFSRCVESLGKPDVVRSIAEGIDPRVRHNAVSKNWHPLHVAMYVAQKTLLSNIILNQVGDRTEMANSIEGRPPFLDHKLVEYVNSMPPSMKIMPISNAPDTLNANQSWSFTEKWILRKAVRSFVTEEIANKKKLMYNAPIPHPLRPSGSSRGIPRLTPLQTLLHRRLTRETVDRLGWINWEPVEKTLADFLESPESPKDGGLDRRARRLLYVLSFVVLQERFRVPALIL